MVDTWTVLASSLDVLGELSWLSVNPRKSTVFHWQGPVSLSLGMAVKPWEAFPITSCDLTAPTVAFYMAHQHGRLRKFREPKPTVNLWPNVWTDHSSNGKTPTFCVFLLRLCSGIPIHSCAHCKCKPHATQVDHFNSAFPDVLFSESSHILERDSPIHCPGWIAAGNCLLALVESGCDKTECDNIVKRAQESQPPAENRLYSIHPILPSPSWRRSRVWRWR